MRAIPPDRRFLDLVQAIVTGDAGVATELVDRFPDLLHKQAAVGATRNRAASDFFQTISHYMYAGDTALHMAAAGFQYDIVRMLIERSAGCLVRNRRGAQPLHYAADSKIWKPAAQAATIDCLIQAGADPNAADKSGVSPLPRRPHPKRAGGRGPAGRGCRAAR